LGRYPIHENVQRLDAPISQQRNILTSNGSGVIGRAELPV